jgi:hypothetical protein
MVSGEGDRMWKQPGRGPTVVRGAAATIVLSLTLGCGSAEEASNLPDDRLWESEHFRYHTRQGDDGACEAVLEQLERHFELMQGYLGFSWPAQRKVDYYKFRDDADFEQNSGCPAIAAGCARGSSVLSSGPLHEHELIHAYLAPLALPPAFLNEGLASVLACHDAATLKVVTPWRDVVGLPYEDLNRVYLEGPWFVGYLLHHYGPEPFLSLYGKLSYESATVDEIATTFESVYGETLDAVWDAAVAEGNRIRCVNLWPCSGPVLPLDGTLQGLSRACDGTDATRTFGLEAETDLVLGSLGYYLEAPLRCDEELPYYAGGDEDFGGVVFFPALVHMGPGNYFVRSYGGSPNEVSVRTLDARALSRDCTELEPVDLGAAEFVSGHLELSIPGDQGEWFAKLRPTRALWWGSTASPEVEQCDGCVASTCRPFEGDAGADADGNVTLRLSPKTSKPGYVTYTLGY